MRTHLSTVLSLAIFIAFVESPFLHSHQHESTQLHAGPVFHLHLGLTHHSSNAPEFQGLNPDDDAQLQSWLSLDANGLDACCSGSSGGILFHTRPQNQQTDGRRTLQTGFTIRPCRLVKIPALLPPSFPRLFPAPSGAFLICLCS